MNKDITTLIYKGLYSHQTFIKNILLMKEETGQADHTLYGK